MTFRYDHENDVLDIRLSDDSVARTEEIDSGTLVDLDMHGQIVSIEVIAPGRQWPLEQILDRYVLPEADRAVLRELWHEGAEFPFARTSMLAPA
jgi:uncharacterized protein YuzE